MQKNPWELIVKTKIAMSQKLIKIIDELIKNKEKINNERLILSEMLQRKSSLIEKQRDLLWILKLEFVENLTKNKDEIIIVIEKALDSDKHAFCIMPPQGGPYFTGNVIYFGVTNVGFGYLEVVLDSNIGFINLLKDPCGIDNLERLKIFAEKS